MMQVICAWCRKFISGAPHAIEVSHGICPACLDKVLAEVPPLDPRFQEKSVALQG